MSTNSLIVYFLGALLLIGGIAYAFSLAHMPFKWIGAFVLFMVGIAVVVLSRKMLRVAGKPPS
jgi:uncharacterized membrane protein YecN with MAPEG domain